MQLYLTINSPNSDLEKTQLAYNLLTKGQLKNFYHFKLLDSPPQFVTQLIWVNVICEIVKQADTLTPILDNDMVSLCHQLNQLSHPLMVDITLQTCCPSDYTNIKKLLPNNHKVPKHYFFKHNLKILAYDKQDMHLISDCLLQNAWSNPHYQTQEIILKSNGQRFHQLFNTTEKTELHSEADNADRPTPLISQKTQQSKPKQNIIRLPETEPLTLSQTLGSSGELVKVEQNWSLGKYFNNSSTSNSAASLKNFNQLVTPQEISGLFRLVVAGESAIPGIPQAQLKFIKPTADQLFNQYAHHIKEDQYIIGVKDNGDIIYGNWHEIPHRLVAGITRSGKTNFLHWLIFQFLYAQPQGKIYIMDFKGGGDFSFYQNINLLEERVKVITTVEAGHQLLTQEIDQDFEHRKNLINQQQRHKFDGARILLIVDEAADIALEIKTDKIKREIDGKLEKIARKGATFKINLIYCTQTPKVDIINTQVTSQLSNRIVFHIKAEVGNSVLEDKLLNYATKIPEVSGRGRAAIAGNDTIEYVNTPEIKQFPSPDLPIDQTLWGKIIL